ncbi:MAG: DUF4091 domain-containing protein [Eubacteriales bacterium]|nr:DUF4091 domain-containing protein [Eubacteriales bacterium]
MELSTIDRSLIDFVPVDSLQKIFMKHEPLSAPVLTEISALRGETVSFQTAYRYRAPYYSSQMLVQATKNPSVTLSVEAPDGISCRIRRVGYVPSAYPAYAMTDSEYLTTEPGLFPDPLEELTGSFQLIPFYWRSLWLDLTIPEDFPAGTSHIFLILRDLQGNLLKKVRVSLNVEDAVLPSQTLIRTEWFHSDCLADYYHVPVFSEEYWHITENFMRCAVSRGINMILTPLFGLPLDTYIGKERTHVQLIGVTRQGGSYTFDFSAFDRWIRLAKQCGYLWFEMGHLFSQWGAKYSPKIVVKTASGEKDLFGWHVPADDPTYCDFLHQFLPQLTKRLRSLGIASHTFFHISDEPNERNIETFKKARDIVKEDLKDFTVLDALSTLQYYQEGIIEQPVPTNQHIHEFLDAGFAHPWVYYCSGEFVDVSNRFMAQPSWRCRILGVQMYLYQIEGFLHWGYNFYNSQYSLHHIDPYRITDAEDAFPSGDSFLVYPGADGTAVESLRLITMQEAVNDYEVLKKLEQLRGRSWVHEMIETLAGQKITFSDYPRNAEFLLRLRAKANHELGLAQSEQKK